MMIDDFSDILFFFFSCIILLLSCRNTYSVLTTCNPVSSLSLQSQSPATCHSTPKLYQTISIALSIDQWMIDQLINRAVSLRRRQC